MDRAIIGSIRTCRIFAGLLMGNFSLSTGTVFKLSFCAFPLNGSKIK
jgi:hypothetical protein